MGIDRLALSAAMILGLATIFATAAQSNAPAVPDSPNPRDTGIKMRSVELERIEREANKINAAATARVNPQVESRFQQVKEDFESIQSLEAAIVKTYRDGKVIDFALIETNGDLIAKRARRLDSNLFVGEVAMTELDATTRKPKKPKELRDLIVDLDEAIGRFVGSTLFKNLVVVDPEVAAKTRADLILIRQLSKELATEAKKLKRGEG